MSNSIRIPLPNTLDLDGDGRVTLGELIRSAWAIAFSLLTGLNVIYWGLVLTLYIITCPWETWRGALKVGAVVFVLSFGISVLVGVLITIRRNLRYERGEKEAKTDLDHERKRRKFELDQIMGVTQQEHSTNWDNAKQDYYARLFLTMSYNKGSFVTRDEWKDKGQPEDAWNRINKLMQKHRIRHGRSTDLQYETFAHAWGIWCDAMLNSRAWVKSGNEYLND